MAPIDSNRDIWSLVEKTLTESSDRVAFVIRHKRDDAEVWTWQHLANAVAIVSSEIEAKALPRGSVVALMAPNGPHWASTAIALWRMGMIVAPIHLGNSDGDIARQIEAVGAVSVVRFGTDRTVDRQWDIHLDANTVTGRALSLPASAPLQPDLEATRIYTSGSTGVPKVVRLSHGNMTSNVITSRQLMRVTYDDRFLSLLPLSHAYEMTGTMLVAMSCGASMVVPHTLAASEILAALVEDKVTLMVAVPRLYRNIMHGLERKLADAGMLARAYVAVLRKLPQPLKKVINGPLLKHFGPVRIWASGGSRLDPGISVFFHSIGLDLRQGYGMTETSPVISAQDRFDSVLEGVGRPLDGIEVRIESPDSEGQGELWVRGPNVMMGYTSEALTRDVMRDDWLHTGDLARLTSDGKLVLTGRSKRLIVTDAGKNVYPEELEILLERHTDVLEAGVVEVDMKPVAILAMDGSGREQRAKVVLKAFNTETSAHNRITRFAITDELPRTPLGKVALMQLPDMFAANEITNGKGVN